MKKALVLVRNATDRELLGKVLAELDLATCFTYDLSSQSSPDLALVLVEETLAELWIEQLLSLKQRAEAELHLLPVLVLLPQERPLGKWLSVGFDDVLTIPMSKEICKARIANWARLAEETTGRFREWVETARVGFYRTTPDGKILYANAALAELLGFSSVSELTSRNLQEGFGPESLRAKFKELIEARGSVTEFEAVWVKKNGEKVVVVESARAVRDQNGKILYYEGTVQDITPIRRYQERLAKIGEFGRKLVLAHSMEEVAQAVVNAAQDILGMEDCGIFFDR